MAKAATKKNKDNIPTELALPSLEKFTALGELQNSCLEKLRSASTEFAKTYILARGVQEMKHVLDEETMKPIMALQGSSLGFKTDQVYEWKTVRDCTISALFEGLQPIGNEFNIIAGNMYAAQAGLERLVNEKVDGYVKHTPGVPEIKGDRALLHYKAEFRLPGDKETHVEELDFKIRVNRGMGEDAIIGKGRRKMLLQIWRNITGSGLKDADVDELPLRNVTPPSQFTSDKEDRADDFFKPDPKKTRDAEFSDPQTGKRTGKSKADPPSTEPEAGSSKKEAPKEKTKPDSSEAKKEVEPDPNEGFKDLVDQMTEKEKPVSAAPDAIAQRIIDTVGAKEEDILDYLREQEVMGKEKSLSELGPTTLKALLAQADRIGKAMNV